MPRFLRNFAFALVCVFLAGAPLASDLTFQPIYFSNKSTRLDSAAKAALKRVATLLASNPSSKLRLIGHTGKEGEGIDFQKLSDDRAAAARDYLVSVLKVDSSRLEILGKAAAEPFRADAPNAIENRRVEFAFFSDQSASGTETKSGLEVVNVLYWNTLYHCLYQIGLDRGFFEKEGFKINLVGTNHSIVNQVKAICSIEPFLRSGNMVFSGSVCGGSPHEAIANGVPLVIIGGMLAGGSLLMAKPEMAAKLKANWKNYKGIRVGRPKGTVLTSMILSDRLKKEGLEPSTDVVWKEYNTHEGVVDALASGEIDAGDTYVPLNVQAAKKHGLVEVFNTVQLFPFHPCCRVITTKSKLAESRDKYVRFMKALIRAHEYFVKNPKASFKIVQKYTGYSYDEVAVSLSNPNFILNPDPLKKGSVKFWKMMIDTGFIKSNLDIANYIDTTVYRDALSSLMKTEPQNDYLKYMFKQYQEQD